MVSPIYRNALNPGSVERTLLQSSFRMAQMLVLDGEKGQFFLFPDLVSVLPVSSGLG